MKDISKVISKITSPILKKKGLAFGTLLEDWDQLVPIEHQGMALPKSLAFPRGENREAKLTLLVPNNSVALYFQYVIPMVKDRINQHFGYPIVKEITLKTDPTAFADLSQPQKKLDCPKTVTFTPFEDPDMEESLRSVLEDFQNSLRNNI